MDINKNSYTFGFAVIMVIIVALLLSGSSIFLKDPQQRNIELEKKEILRRYRKLLRLAKPFLKEGDTKIIKKSFNLIKTFYV